MVAGTFACLPQMACLALPLTCFAAANVASAAQTTERVSVATGGTEAKPVGTVHIAVVSDTGEHAQKFLFPGDRSMIKERSAMAALDLLRRRL